MPSQRRRSRRAPNFIQEHPILLWTIIIIVILAALNFALLLPSVFATIFYEVEQFFIRLFLLPITLNRIELFIILIIVAVISYFLVPMIWIPYFDEAFFYKKVEYEIFENPEGEKIELMIFIPLFKKNSPVAFPRMWVRKKWLKYVVIGKPAQKVEYNKTIIYDNENLDIMKAIGMQSYVEALQERIANLEDEIATAREIFKEKEEKEEK